VRFRRCAGGAALAIGVSTLGAWWFGFDALKSWVAGWPTMKPVTATLCILSGAALVLLGSEMPARARIAGKVAAALVVALAGVTLVEVLFSFSAGLDALLAGRSAGVPFGRTGAAFLLVGAGLLSIDRVTPRGHSPAQLAALGAASIASVALLGYTFGLWALHSRLRNGTPSGMAVHTAFTLVLLASGLLVTRPEVGLVSAVSSEYAGGVVSRRLLLGLLAFVPVALLVVIGRRLHWYHDASVAALLVFLAFVEGAVLIHVTAVRLNAYDLRQKTVEDLLRRSEQRIGQLIGHAPDGIFVADLDGRYIDVNEAACHLLGLPREQIVGKTIVDFVAPADVERLLRIKEELLGGGASKGEWALRRHDGSFVTVDVATKILPDGRWQAVVRDITERKRHEAELAEARERDRQLRAELEKVTQAAASVSESVAELPKSELSAVLQTIALQAQVLTGARYVAVGFGTDPDRPFEPWVALGTPPQTVEKLGWHPQPVSHFRDLPADHPEMSSFLGVPIRYRGRPIGNLYLANKQDASEFTAQDQRMVEMLAARAAVAMETARLYADEAQQRARLRNIVDQMPDAVIILDADGHIVTTNRAVLPFTSEDTPAVGAQPHPTIFDLRSAAGAPLPREDLPATRALERGEASVGRELAMRKRDGTLVPVLASAAPIRDDDGRVTGATVVIQDISALKELERLREEWASVIAHDLRSPVSSIALAAQMLERLDGSDAPEKRRRAIARICSSVARLSRMIDDLFDASRIEARRLSVTPQAVDLGSLIDGVAETLRDAIEDHKVRVDARKGQYAWIDPGRIQQVLTNLITNAAKHGEPGTEICVGAASHDEVVEVTVTNRGRGIPADELPLLFSRFERTRGARAAGTPGTGLGLYIAKGLIEAHGGRIWVDSTPGELTTFHFVVASAPFPAHAAGGASPPA
jgi:PAS domain S-box-containing protein